MRLPATAGSQRAELDRILLSYDRAEPTVVVDDTWPAATRARADADVAAAVEHRQVGAGDLVVFSSGSTDHPRGVVRTWHSWQASADALTELIATSTGAVGIPGRLGSSLSLHGAWHARANGRDVVLADEWTTPALATVTVVHCLPDRPLRWATWPSALQTLVVAGDRTAPALRDQCAARGVRLVEYYGSVEASFVLASASGADVSRDRPAVGVTSSGRAAGLDAFAGVEVRLDDDGRLWSRSEYEFRGYLGQAADRGFADGPARRDAAGWLTVGDHAERVGNGYRLLGREGTVTTGGHSVQVAEVEAALSGAPGVRAVVVSAVRHEVLGEVIGAVVETADASDAALDSLRAWAVRVMPSASRPRQWRLVTELPRTSAGKPDRAAARSAFESS